MFSAPERQTNTNGESFFKVNLIFPALIGSQFLLKSAKDVLEPNEAAVPLFEALQTKIIKELMHNRQLFKNAPSKESLDVITPKWGIVFQNGKPLWSPYTIVNQTNTIGTTKFPARVDLELAALHISRTCIKPVFEVVYVGPQMEENVIDFDWSQSEELSEVSDIGALDDAGMIELRDPASIRQKRAAAKQSIRAMYHEAAEVRERADDAAAKFHEEFDLSDGESAFSEWHSDDDDSETNEESA
jgi:hypothetical protein